MLQAEHLALQQTISILLHLLPDDKKQLAYAVIESIRDQDYESTILNTDPDIPVETAKNFAKKIASTYSQILESAQGFDENNRLSDVE